MTEPTRAVARPPIGSENHLPTWTRESLSREVFRAMETTRMTDGRAGLQGCYSVRLWWASSLLTRPRTP